MFLNRILRQTKGPLHAAISQIESRIIHAPKQLRAEFTNYSLQYSGLNELMEMAHAEKDEGLKNIVEEDYRQLGERLDEFNLRLALSGDGDENDCFIELRAGSGGEEACDWCHIMSKMYQKWASTRDYKSTVLDYTTSKEGYKSCSIQIEGKFAFGYLKQEQGIYLINIPGVHRFVRISPFDSNAKRHTSFVSVLATPVDTSTKINSAKQIEIPASELKIETTTSQGAGGQHVNKTESAVRITHIPTKITVFCQAQRSQHQNKALALLWLQAKLYARQQLEQQSIRNEMYNSQGEIAWGNQIRNYVLTPYQMIKDTRTGMVRNDVNNVLEGDVHGFMEEAVLMFGNLTPPSTEGK